MNNEYTYDEQLNNYLARTFAYMGIAVLISALSGYLARNIVYYFYQMPFLLIVLFALQFGICIYFGTQLFKMQPRVAMMLLVLYSMITGVSLGSVFLVYSGSSLALTFVITAMVFASMGIIGFTTRIDLTKYSFYLFFGLLCIIIVSVVNIFLRSTMIEMVTTYIGIILFLGITAYDVQKLKAFYYSDYDYEIRENLAIYSAFQLYLDFINLFLYLIRIFGKRRK